MWNEHRETPWPKLLGFWGLPDLQVINRENHVAKCAGEASDIGTVINEKQFRKVCGYVEEGLNRREARVVIGGLLPNRSDLLRPKISSRARRQSFATFARMVGIV